MSWRDVVIPWPLSERPRDPRGYPIPWNVPVVEVEPGVRVPQFREVDPNKNLAALAGRLCALCGTEHHPAVSFVGGPVALERELFTEPPMHVECALYALRVCPFLIVKDARYSGAPHRPETELVEGIGEGHPSRFALVIAGDYKLVLIPGTEETAYQPVRYFVDSWWREGRMLSDPDSPDP